ncbi:unnamed protein product, partial [Cyprideis torosa]
MKTSDKGFDTQLIHAGDFTDEFGSAVTPIYQTSTFAFKSAEKGADIFAGKEKGYIYTRISNPTIEALENKLAELEEGFGGVALSSGMAAVTTVYSAILKAGDHMVSSNAVYGPSRVVMETIFADFGVESSYVDTSNLEKIKEAIQPNTKLLYLETPANPTMNLTDIQEARNMDPHQAYMVIRGVKTLALRVERAQDSAMKVAEYLENHHKVEWVKYPGLSSFPQKDLADKQMSGYGAMISFSLKGGHDAGVAMMNNVKLALLAVSLGGVETLIQHPASMTHAGLSKQVQEESGISGGLVRFSVGIENVEDIIDDLDQAL